MHGFSLTHSLTHSLIHSFIHSFTHSLTHSFLGQCGSQLVNYAMCTLSGQAVAAMIDENNEPVIRFLWDLKRMSLSELDSWAAASVQQMPQWVQHEVVASKVLAIIGDRRVDSKDFFARISHYARKCTAKM